MKKTLYSVLAALTLGITLINPACVYAQEEVDLPFVPETEELPPRPFMPKNPPAIEVQVDVDAQGYEWTEEKEFFFNVKNEDGSVDETFSVVIDPNDENFDGKGTCRVFLDFGTYTITALEDEQLDGYTFINNTYGNENQIAVVQESLLTNIVPVSFTKHYGLKEILEEKKIEKAHRYVVVNQPVENVVEDQTVQEMNESKPEVQTKVSETIALKAEHRDMKLEKQAAVKKVEIQEQDSTNWVVPGIVLGTALVVACLRKRVFVK